MALPAPLLVVVKVAEAVPVAETGAALAASIPASLPVGPDAELEAD